jgi:hypothetical protein
MDINLVKEVLHRHPISALKAIKAIIKSKGFTAIDCIYMPYLFILSTLSFCLFVPIVAIYSILSIVCSMYEPFENMISSIYKLSVTLEFSKNYVKILKENYLRKKKDC